MNTKCIERNFVLVVGEIGSSLLPGLDDTEQTKFLDEHDLNEVLNKLPEEAFDIFTGITGGKHLENEFRNKKAFQSKVNCPRPRPLSHDALGPEGGAPIPT